MAQGRGAPGRIEADRREAQFHVAARIDRRAQRRGDHLAAKAYAQRRPVGGQTRGELFDLGRDPGMDVGFIDAHRAAHHDEEIRIAQVHPGEVRAGDINPIYPVAGRLDRLEISRSAFPGNMTDDKSGFHC